jgi:uncharacterized membrane protein YidH (DUF202 family)
MSDDDSPNAHNVHLLWARNRMLVDDELLDFTRHGFSLIAAGFGSFSLFEGLTVGERHVSPIPRTFALIMTAIGVIVILLALRHAARMTVWVNADAFGEGAAPPLPDENRLVVLAIAAVVIGVVSFVALLMLP